MELSVSKLTVFFDDPFWVAVWEREFCGKYEACRIVFGAEPKDYEVYDYILSNYTKLQFSPAIKTEFTKEKRINPKRMQREINKQLDNTGVGTKAMQALKLQQEQNKLQRCSKTKEEREAEEERRFELRQEKRKEKHRGH